MPADFVTYATLLAVCMHVEQTGKKNQTHVLLSSHAFAEESNVYTLHAYLGYAKSATQFLDRGNAYSLQCRISKRTSRIRPQARIFAYKQGGALIPMLESMSLYF